MSFFLSSAGRQVSSYCHSAVVPMTSGEKFDSYHQPGPGKNEKGINHSSLNYFFICWSFYIVFCFSLWKAMFSEHQDFSIFKSFLRWRLKVRIPISKSMSILRLFNRTSLFLSTFLWLIVITATFTEALWSVWTLSLRDLRLGTQEPFPRPLLEGIPQCL